MSDNQTGSSEVIAGRWFISGRVQGVGFRWFVIRQAERFDIRGCTRNLADGRVEILAAGRRADLLKFEEAVSEGPRMSRVDNVEKIDIAHELVQDKTFSII